MVYTGLSQSTLYRLARAGELTTLRRDGWTYYAAQDLGDVMQRRESSGENR